ncbi:MAG: hypothetical protein KF712_17315 [Akkermansiaceae bacterium]|nr:hypothetical protein [Akkermansiaceae bacterium]
MDRRRLCGGVGIFGQTTWRMKSGIFFWVNQALIAGLLLASVYLAEKGLAKPMNSMSLDDIIKSAPAVHKIFTISAVVCLAFGRFLFLPARLLIGMSCGVIALCAYNAVYNTLHHIMPSSKYFAGKSVLEVMKITPHGWLLCGATVVILLLSIIPFRFSRKQARL